MDYSSQPLTTTFINLKNMNADDERLQHLQVHLKTGDYFATLTTIMGFVEDTLRTAEASNKPLKEREMVLIQDLKKDLMHLQDNYRIEPKTAETFGKNLQS